MAASPPAPRPRSPLMTGDHAPWFRAPALSGSPDYAFDTAAGRFIVLLFMGTAAEPAVAEALRAVERHRGWFDDARACFFGVTTDPTDAGEGRIAQALPGVRYFLDYSGEISRTYGALVDNRYLPHWLLLEPTLQVAASFPLAASEGLFTLLQERLSAPAPQESLAPVLRVPHVLPADLCRRLVDGYEADGGEDSGFMREVDGRTVLQVDPQHKRRRDWIIADEKLRDHLNARINRMLVPAIERAFQFRATRIERHIVACYEAGAGHFRPHRDNTTKGTAHRRFAVTINLNDGYDGGDLRFPEFGARTYRAPLGGAVVFSCSLLHEATPVTSGKRYAFLPFLYDEAGAKLREQNSRFLADGLGSYKAGEAAAG